LKQNGFVAETKAQIEKNYINNWGVYQWRFYYYF
jgi:hypothetical protein